MTATQLALGAYKRSLNPESILLNCYVEKAPTQQENPVQIRGRAGFPAFKTVGTGPIRGIMVKAGLFDNSAVVISGSTVFLLDDAGTATAQLGTVIANVLVDIDAGRDADLNSVCRFATGDRLYNLTGGSVFQEDFPTVGGAGASSICEHRGFWFGTETGTQQAFFLIPGDTAWQALSFASAEYSPDALKGIRSRGDQFVLLGEETTEVWALTGQADPAIAPYGGLNFDFGCRSIRTAVNCAGVLIWVDHRCVVRSFAGGGADAISDPGLTEQIAAADPGDIRASWYAKDGHSFYVLTIGSMSTWVWDLTEQTWHRSNSSGLDYFRAHLFASIGDTVLAADAINTQIYRADPTARVDGASDPIQKKFTAFHEQLEGAFPCVNVELICETGDAPRTGQGSDPKIQMAYSDDNGKSDSGWIERSLGVTGQSATVRWSGLPDIVAPYGRIFYFQCSDPVGFRITSLRMNAA